jgi:hypothetical protein
MKELDIALLTEFLEYANCRLYFTPDPFLKGGDSLRINTIDITLLNNMVVEFNKERADNNFKDTIQTP